MNQNRWQNKSNDRKEKNPSSLSDNKLNYKNENYSENAFLFAKLRQFN
jgi:hypothetical protein